MKLYIYMIFIVLIIQITISCNEKAPPTKPSGTIVPDTTSHNFEWQITFLGEGASSYLKDVAIIDEDNIWAVGEIYLKDSLGTLKNAFNLIHWDGIKWNYYSIQFPVYNSNATATFATRAIFSIGLDQIWITSAGAICIKKGDSFSKIAIPSELLPGSINKLWGGGGNYYIVGNKGTIIFYNEASWQKLESNTTQPINDIWGVYNPNTKQSRIFCVASDKYHGGEKKVLQIMDDLTVQEFD